MQPPRENGEKRRARFGPWDAGPIMPALLPPHTLCTIFQAPILHKFQRPKSIKQLFGHFFGDVVDGFRAAAAVGCRHHHAENNWIRLLAHIESGKKSRGARSVFKGHRIHRSAEADCYGRSKPRPGRPVGCSMPFFKRTAPAVGSSSRSR